MKTQTSPSASSAAGAALNRRQFIHRSLQTTAVLGALSAFPFVSRGRVLGANDRIGVGYIGVGGRGRSHVGSVQNLIKAGANLKTSDHYRGN